MPKIKSEIENLIANKIMERFGIQVRDFSTTKNGARVFVYGGDNKKIQKADLKLEKMLGKVNKKTADEEQDEDEIHDEDDKKSRFPNLKYARSKYKNIESILKYNENEEEGDKQGVRIVIMNFND